MLGKLGNASERPGNAIVGNDRFSLNPGMLTENDGNAGRLGSESDSEGSAIVGRDRFSLNPGMLTAKVGSPGSDGNASERLGTGIIGSEKLQPDISENEATGSHKYQFRLWA